MINKSDQKKFAPFCYADLKGTRWYRRFITCEYSIFLDNYPERIIIKDSVLELFKSNTDKEEKAIKDYEEFIVSYFLNDDGLDLKTPLQILLDLRGLREKIFPGIMNCSKVLCKNTHKGPGLSEDLEENTIENLYPGYKIDFKADLEEKLKKSKNIIFVPGEEDFLPGVIKVLRTFTDGIIEIVPVDSPFSPGIHPSVIEEVLGLLKDQSIKLSDRTLRTMNGEMSLDSSPLADDKGFLFTTNIWFYLSILRNTKEIGFILSNREWVSRGLFQESWDIPSNHLEGMMEGSYTSLVKRVNPSIGKMIGGLQKKIFPLGVNLTGSSWTSLDLSSFLEGMDPADFHKFSKESSRYILEKNKSIDYQCVKYDYDEDGTIQKVQDDKVGVLVSTLIIPEEDALLEPLLFGSCLAPEELDLNGKGFLFSFNYYFTSNLVFLHNSETPERQHLHFENFFIDYIGGLTDDGWKETIPLYSKAMIGSTSDGRLFAGRFRVDEISLFLDEKEMIFDKTSINPEGCCEKDVLYLPSSGVGEVGEGQTCLVLVQDQAVFFGTGPCLIPSVGCIIVFNKNIDKKPEKISWETRFIDLPHKKENLSWLVGGLNLLCCSGENLYSSKKSAIENLALEGWMTKESRKTQETALDPSIRQPRLVVGRTGKGKIIVSFFSGRTDFSCGATFTETVLHTESLLYDGDEIDFLVNMDGGASSSLIYYEDELRLVTGLTAPSLTNPAGTARRLSGYLSLKLNS
ncbi:MAG: hypothetical protein JEY99_16875 [Spirochaetales bacterium]|nr:hypothetical protein [Spirochaetales bacterium]